MAEVYATKTGVWSDDTVWNTGTAPTASDDVYANGYTVTIDEDVTVSSIRNTAGSTAAANGEFLVTDNDRTIVADILSGGTGSNECINWTGTGTLTLTGNVTGPAGGNQAYGLRVGGAGSALVMTGNALGGAGANAAAIAVYGSGCTVSITGDVTGGSGAGGADGTAGLRAGDASVTITGNVTGGTHVQGIGVLGGSVVLVNGNILSNVAAAIASGAKVEVNGELQVTANHSLPIQSGSIGAYFGKACFTSSTIYRGKDSGGSELTLSAAGTDQADPADVRSGTSYNHGASTGTLAVPDAQYVSLGVAVDATVGTLTGASLASGTAQGGTSTTIQLAASETFGDDILNGNIVKITGGTGAGQSRRITDYVGSTDTATVNEAWATNPDNTSTYEVVEGSHVTGISAAEVNAEVVDVINVDTLVAGVTVAEALRRIGAVCSYKISGAGSGTETVTPWDDGAETIVFTVDSSGNRTAVTFN